MDGKDSLRILREEIEKVTLEILELCGRRLFLARKIGEIKTEEGIPIEDLDVEERLKSKIVERCRHIGLDPKFGLRLLDILLDESKRIQRTATS